MAEQDQLPEPARSESLSLPPVHATGSVRTEGFYRLAKRQAAPKSPKRGFAADAKRDQNQEPDDTADVLSSRRSDRADRRRFCAALPAASTVLQGNALASRKKSLQLFRSSIHAWGVRTTEPLLAGELVIEYIGEIISARVADIREKQYERSGIGSSYFFKVDDDMIIDATKQGNLARYINHSCMPNCKARVVTVGTTRRIAIYALRAIRPGEELSYDYKFADEPEEDKIPCWCGTKRCRGFLN
ncbi:hypothetical protein PBRA_002587 [Plasmodiophora brassicae]|nr:hypothetical protein PBRA_002587 [Plasmodiophora brassicae]